MKRNARYADQCHSDIISWRDVVNILKKMTGFYHFLGIWSLLFVVLILDFHHVDSSEVPGGDDRNFSCFACSYVHPKTNGMDCVNNTNYLKLLPSYSVKCGNYCVTSEVLDKKTKKITSLFRSCSVFWGNDCMDDPYTGVVNCKTSCKGRFCNNFTVDEQHIEDICSRYDCSRGRSSCNLDLILTLHLIILTFVVLTNNV